MNIREYRELYEGLTQEDDAFRNAIYNLVDDDLTGQLITELELAENRINHAMLGVHPLYRREVELSGIVDYDKKMLRLYAFEGEKALPFTELDPAYVSFLESQKRIYNVKETMPLSSVALKTSSQCLAMDNVPTPNLDGTEMHLPEKDFSVSRKVLETAFARSMMLMNHLHEEIQKYGLDTAYGANREDLIQYCRSNSFNFQFNYSVNELTETAQDAAHMDELTNQ